MLCTSCVGIFRYFGQIRNFSCLKSACVVWKNQTKKNALNRPLQREVRRRQTASCKRLYGIGRDPETTLAGSAFAPPANHTNSKYSDSLMAWCRCAVRPEASPSLPERLRQPRPLQASSCGRSFAPLDRTRPRARPERCAPYGINRSLQHGPFSAKRETLFVESNLHLNRDLMRVDYWDEEAITQRGRALFEIANRIWRGPERVAA
jgi:hypothetical protein